MIALLPMRAGSKRVPKKNIRFFNGKPLFYYVLNSLVKAHLISKIIINTDDDEIVSLAKNFISQNNLEGSQIDIHNRPKSLGGDHVSMNEVIAYDLEKVQDEENFIQVHATSPLLSSETIDKAIECYFNKIDQHDSVVSVTKLQERFYDESFSPVNHSPDKLLRTQDLPPLYTENSAFYIFSRTSFYESDEKRIGKRPYYYILNKLESTDIDEEEDFRIAEALSLAVK